MILPWDVLSDGGSFSKPLACSINVENSSPLPSKKKSFRICKTVLQENSDFLGLSQCNMLISKQIFRTKVCCAYLEMLQQVHIFNNKFPQMLKEKNIITFVLFCYLGRACSLQQAFQFAGHCSMPSLMLASSLSSLCNHAPLTGCQS